jgi:hypothetical protein
VTLVSEKVAEMSIDKENVRYDLDTIGGRSSLRGSGAVHIPLALKGGGIHALKAFVTNKPLKHKHIAQNNILTERIPKC